MLSTLTDVNAALRWLTEKYAVRTPAEWHCHDGRNSPPDEPGVLAVGWALLAHPAVAHAIPLLPWRNERRFVELKRLVDNRTVEGVSLCRFSCVTTGSPMGLAAVLYREFDLVEWLIGSPIVAIHASMAAGRFANLLATLQSGVVASIEAGVTLPAESRPAVIDRHELIARRGVASDRVVDTQVPQSSVYTFTAAGAAAYTDTDAELFGLENDEINLVRAAFELAARPDAAAIHRSLLHRRLPDLADRRDRRKRQAADLPPGRGRLNACTNGLPSRAKRHACPGSMPEPPSEALRHGSRIGAAIAACPG